MATKQIDIDSALPPKDERIESIARLMSLDQYQPNVTPRILAAKWKCSLHTVMADVWAAARDLRVPPEQKEGARAQLAATFYSLAVQARDAGEYRSAVSALESYARFAGIDVVHQVELSGRGAIVLLPPEESE